MTFGNETPAETLPNFRQSLSPPQRQGSYGFFSSGVHPLSNVSAGTKLQATAVLRIVDGTDRNAPIALNNVMLSGCDWCISI